MTHDPPSTLPTLETFRAELDGGIFLRLDFSDGRAVTFYVRPGHTAPQVERELREAAAMVERIATRGASREGGDR